MLIYGETSAMSEIKQLPSFDDIANLFAKSTLNAHPSFAHGFWLGMICGGRHVSPKDWMDRVLGQKDVWGKLPTDLQHMLLAIAEATVEQLGDPEYSLQIFLPDDDDEIDDRVHALSEWCAGFMQAFRHCNQDHENLLQGDAAEALADLNEITQLSLELEDDPEEEQNFLEVVEYVRVALLLIHQDILSKQAQPAGDPPPIH